MQEILNKIADIIPLEVLLPILVIQLVMMFIAIVSCIRTEETNGPKWLWILIIIFLNILGPVLYFLFGRKNQ